MRALLAILSCLTCTAFPAAAEERWGSAVPAYGTSAFICYDSDVNFICFGLRCNGSGPLEFMWLSTGSGLSGRTRALVWVDGARAGTLDFTPLPKAQNTVEHTFEAVAPFKAAEHRRLVERLRAGRRMRLQRLEGENPSPNPARGVPFSLAGSSREIARVMAACPVAPAGPSGLDVAAAKAAEISRACQDGTGYFEPRGVIEADLNGDGRQDLALSHHGIVCDEGGRSIYCGAKLCSYHVFLDTGRGLADVHDGLSIGMSLGEGDPPQVRVFAGDGSEHALVWTGNGFAVRPR